MQMKQLKYLLIATILFLFFTLPALAAETRLTGKVMKVIDGDTVVTRPIDGGAFLKCRLYGIDAPETPKYGRRGRLKIPGQPYGEEATSELKKDDPGANATSYIDRGNKWG